MKSSVSFKQVIVNILTLFSGTTLARILSAVTLMLIARQVGPEAFGQYTASIALIGVTSTLFSLGLDGWLLYEGGRKEDELNVSLTSALCLKVVLGIVWIAGLWALAPRLNQASFPWILIFLGSLSIWMEEIARVTWSAFKVCLRNDLTLILMTGLQGLFLGATLWLASHHVQEPEGYLAGRLLATFLGATASVLLLIRRLGLRLRPEAFRLTLRGTLPFAASIALAMIYGRADLTIVANELGKTAASVYGPAITLTNALFLIPAAIFGVMVPFLSQSYGGNPKLVKQISLRLIPSMTLLGLGLGSALTYLSHSLVLLIYGTPFEASADVLAILGGVLALRFPNVALAAVLVAVGWQIPRVGVQALSAALNITLNFLIVHRLGVIGAAKVYVLTEAVLFLGYLVAFLLWTWKEKKVAGSPESY